MMMKDVMVKDLVEVLNEGHQDSFIPAITIDDVDGTAQALIDRGWRKGELL